MTGDDVRRATTRWRLIKASAPRLARWLKDVDGLLAAWRRLEGEGDLEHEELDAFVHRWNVEHAATQLLRRANRRRY
jgi:hypothetical protein